MINRIHIRTVLATMAIVVTASIGSAAAATTFTVNAPNAGALSAQITLTDATQLTFSVQRSGAMVLSPSQIGIVTTTADLSTGLTFVARADRVVTESYTTPTGKQRSRTATFTETTLSFTGLGGARLNVVVRVGADGAAYRYTLPATGTISVRRELSSWLLPTTAPAWLNDYATDYQGAWRATTAGTAATRMDFTPVTFSIGNRDTSEAHELATGLVFESGWQHFADNPENYTARPTALAMLDQLPTVWDETRLLGGSPGTEAYLARRNGANWYVGGISAVAAKTFTASLSFLGPGQFLVETVRDGATAGTLLRETRTATSADTLSVPEATRGGFLSAICPFTAGMTTCATPRAINLALNRSTAASMPCNANESGAKAVNGSVSGGNSDKWCSGIAGTKTLQVDLGSNQTLRRLVVQHAGAGGESTTFNTRAFTLATSTDGATFTTAATFTSNTASITTSAVNVTARFIRLTTTDAVARIYELEAYAQ